MFNEHFLSYPSTKSAYQSVQHLCTCIFNSHLLLLQFTINLKQNYHIYLIRVELQHFTSFKITTLLELHFSDYGFSIHLSRYQYHYVYFYPPVYSIKYKAPSLILAVSDQLFLLQLHLQFIRKCC